MKRICLAMLLLALLGLAADREEGFVPLFDGKSLTGWRLDDRPENRYVVKAAS